MDTTTATTDLSAGRYSLVMDVGVDITLPFVYESAPDEQTPPVPVDIRGFTFVAEVSKTAGETTTKRQLVTTITDGANGQFSVDFHFEADPYPAGTYRYRITATDTNGDARPLIVSSLTFVDPPPTP